MDSVWFVERLIDSEGIAVGYAQITRKEARKHRDAHKKQLPAASFRVRRYERVENSK